MVKVNTGVLGLGIIDIDETIEVMKDALRFQVDIAKNTDLKESDGVIEFSEKQIALLDAMEAYVVKTLNLNAAQQKKLKKLTGPELDTLSGEIISKVLHYEDVDENSEDPEDTKE